MFKRIVLCWSCAAACGVSIPAFADSYTSTDGYLEVIGYKLQLMNRDGKAEMTVTGRVEALADCSGVTLSFDVFDRGNRKLGVFQATHGALDRHDVWVLGPGTFEPQDATQYVLAAADHVLASDANCRRY